MVRIRLTIQILILFLASIMYGQEDEMEHFMKLYKENYVAWITSAEIRKLQADNPEIAELIDSIPIQQTRVYKEEMAKIKNGETFNLEYENILDEDLVDASLGFIKEMLSAQNTEIITRLYWRIIESAESKEIADIIVQQMEKARDDIQSGSAHVIKRAN